MFDFITNSNLFCKMEMAVWDAEDKIKNAPTTIKNTIQEKVTLENVVKTTFAVGTASAVVGAGASIATMAMTGATKQLVVSSVVYSAKAVTYGYALNELNKDRKEEDKIKVEDMEMKRR